MFRAIAIILISLIGLAGCAGNQLGLEGGQTPTLSYTAPANPPAAPVAFKLNGSVDEVVARLVKALDGPRFGITHVDERQGLITAVYRADPEDFIDCGILDLQPAKGEPLQVAAATRQVRYQFPIVKGYYGNVDRRMQLDGRMLIDVVQETSTQSAVTISGDYVVTRTLRLSGKSGDPTTTRRQLIDFGSGQVGKDVAEKLRCQSNGELESYLLASLRSSGERGAAGESLGAVIDSNTPLLTRVRQQFEKLSCAPLNARSLDDKDIVITGFVSSAEDLQELEKLVNDVAGVGKVIFRVSVTSQAFCEILDVTVPLRETNSIDQAGALVRLANGAFDLFEGEYLIVDVVAPSFESYGYLFYAQQDGKLFHMLPNPDISKNVLKANSQFRIGEDPNARRYSVAAPFGDDMVTFIASTKPLFPTRRPEVEPTASLALDLADRIAKAKADGARVVADLVFVKTTARSF